MKIYLDTGNVQEIKRALDFGVIEGVTTNPSLIAKEGRDFKQVIKEIVALFKKAKVKEFTVSAEITKSTAKEMVKEAVTLAKIDSHVIIKVPLTEEGIIAVKELSQKKIRTNVTLCFSANQALLAAKAGAYIVSPFVGRLDDIGHDGMVLISQIRELYDTYGFKTQILTASIRSPRHVLEASQLGSDIATIPTDIFYKLFHHPLTNSGLEKFMADWDLFSRKQKRK